MFRNTYTYKYFQSEKNKSKHHDCFISINCIYVSMLNQLDVTLSSILILFLAIHARGTLFVFFYFPVTVSFQKFKCNNSLSFLSF